MLSHLLIFLFIFFSRILLFGTGMRVSFRRVFSLPIRDPKFCILFSGNSKYWKKNLTFCSVFDVQGVQGKESNIENIIKESKTTIHIAKHESELAMKLNCATYDGDLYRLRCFIGAGADPNMSDYNDRSPLVCQVNTEIPWYHNIV